MGVSLQQYRAAIGNWQARRKKTYEQSQSPYTSEEELCTTIFKEGICHEGWEIGQRKSNVLFTGLAVTLALMTSLSICSSCETGNNLSSNNSTKETTNLDFAAATGNLISHQCQKALLIMAGVEQNPGPSSGIRTEDEIINKQEDIIAELCADAPNIDIRDCLRLYKPKNNVRQHKSEFSKLNKPVIVSTLDYLSVTGQEDYNKPTCINTLICRIQNLLPDICKLCKSEYCVKRDEISLLSCEICGQGSHNICLWNHFGISQEEQEAFDPKQAAEKINPTSLPGLHYLCGECEETTIPKKEAGLLKRKSTDTTDGDTSQQPQQESHSVGNLEEETRAEAENVALSEQLPLHQEEQNQSPAQPQSHSQLQSQAQAQLAAQKVICSFYRQGTCRFGPSGRGCPHEHPKPCKKLIQHGNKGPNGCTLGRAKCTNYHPKMCHTSLTRGYCYEGECKLRHVSGTKRDLSGTNNISQKKHKTEIRNNETNKTVKKSNEQGDFLGVLHRLKVDMLEAMDTKIAQYISAQTTVPTAGNYTHTASPRISLAQPAQYINSGLQGHLQQMPMQTAQQWGMGIPGQPVYLHSGLNPVASMYMPIRPGSLIQ